MYEIRNRKGDGQVKTYVSMSRNSMGYFVKND